MQETKGIRTKTVRVSRPATAREHNSYTTTGKEHSTKQVWYADDSVVIGSAEGL